MRECTTPILSIFEDIFNDESCYQLAKQNLLRLRKTLFQSLSYVKKENGIGLAHLPVRESGTYPTEEGRL